MAEAAGKYFHTPLVVSYLGIMMLLPLLIVRQWSDIIQLPHTYRFYGVMFVHGRNVVRRGILPTICIHQLSPRIYITPGRAGLGSS